MKVQKNEQKVVANKFIVGPCIGNGSFGEVFVVNVVDSLQIFALKKEDEKSKSPQLLAEGKLLRSLSGNKGFAKVQWYGNECKSNYLVMEMLGPSLEDLFLICKRKFSLKTVLILAVQMVQRIQVLHSKNYLHRDIKPENFLIGLNQQSSTLYLIDFGLCKKYRDSKTKQHQAYKENKAVVGTIRYSSINTHMGIEQSRRDDLQSIGYLLQYFLCGALPWQGMKANSKTQKYRKILQMKTNIPVQVQFKDQPIQFCTYMHYCRALKYEQTPDYSFLKKLFRDLYDRLGFQHDNIFDWCMSKEMILLEKSGLSIQIYNHNKILNEQTINKVSQKELNPVPSILGNSEQITLQLPQKTERSKEQNSEEKRESMLEDSGNIGSDLLDETDMKLLSSRNPWKRSEDI